MAAWWGREGWMLFTDVIRKKRDGGELSSGQIDFLVAGLADSSIPAEQVAAFAMAVFLNSMSASEAGHLTMAMATSGTVLDWKDENLDGPVVDKHSTGGVGDKVSFLLAPIAAACGCYVPMISGRALGHTGGTADKVESIPGYQSAPDFDLFRKVVKNAGCAIIGQTEDLAPADRRFYAIRDVTATVESVPLITASILSKKIAAGLDALVMDIKVGSGAFMTSLDKAQELAASIIATAASANLKTHAIITDMNECLGRTVGNALEIAESVEFLRDNERESRLNDVVLALCAEMLIVSGLERDHVKALSRVDDAVTSGKAAEIFGNMVHGLGGPADFVENYDHYLPAAEVLRPVFATDDGYLAEVDTFQIGNAIIELGGGRRILGGKLDLSVGLSDISPVGAAVNKEQPIAMIHASSDEQFEVAASIIRKACRVSAAPSAKHTVIHKIMTAESREVTID
jgi:thymidine phosphorylase